MTARCGRGGAPTQQQEEAMEHISRLQEKIHGMRASKKRTKIKAEKQRLTRAISEWESSIRSICLGNGLTKKEERRARARARKSK